MGLFAPWFLAGLAALGIPVYVHLLKRHTSTPHPFSSLMFFERRTQSSVKHRRLRYLVLFSLRALLLLLFVLAFANPFINRAAANLTSEKLLLLVIDKSFSMRAGSRLSDARREALSVLSSRPAGERAQIMAMGSQLQVLTQPSQDGGALRGAIENLQPGDSHGNFAELTRAIGSLAGTVHTPIELHFFSDMQKSQMPEGFSELALPANVSLVLHPVVKDAVPNWTVESVNAPSRVWDPKKTRIQAVVAGFETPAATRTVSLIANGKTMATRSIAVPAGGRASVEFQGLDVPYGFTKCEVRIDSADKLPADDAYLFAVERSDPRRGLFVYGPGDTRSPLYFRSALGSAAEAAFALDTSSLAQAAGLPLSNYAFIVLSDVVSLPSSLENSLTRYVQNGGGLWIIAGTSAAHSARIPIFGASVQQSLDYARSGDRFQTIDETDRSFPSVAKDGSWAGVKFYFADRVDPGNSRVIARLTDQTPLLMEKKIGEGTVLLFASGFDNLTNDFPITPAFVPFVEQTVWYLSGAERRSGSRVVDSFLELRSSKEQAVGVEVIDPQGNRPLSMQEAATAQTYRLSSAGFYQVKLASGHQDVIGVNADRRESDLAVVPDDVLALWGKNPAQETAQAAAAEQTQEHTKPFSLWWYIMLLVLVAAVAESLLADQYLGVRREES